MAKYGAFTVPHAKRIAAATKAVEGSPTLMLGHPQQVRQNVASGNCSCVTVHEIRMEGAVTGGTVSLSVGVNNGTSTTSEAVVINWDDTASEVQTAYEGHSQIASGDILVKGGPFPNVSVYVVFLSSGTRNYTQPLPPPTSSLTGTNARCKVGYMTDADWEDS